MASIKTITVNGETYELKDGSAIPAPTKAQTGQVLAVKTVDAYARPTAWECVGVTTVNKAQFSACRDDPELYTCDLTYDTMLNIMLSGGIIQGQFCTELQENQFTAMAYLVGANNGEAGNQMPEVCFVPLMGGIYWHCSGWEDMYLDGDASNQTAGNELWKVL